MHAYCGTLLFKLKGQALPEIVQPKQVKVYADLDGHEPFTEWLYKLRDLMARQRILARIGRIEQGNYGDHASVGEGVSELRFFFGAGYRVYFGEKDGTVVILLNGGDKSSQVSDIGRAKLYWKEYLSRGQS